MADLSLILGPCGSAADRLGESVGARHFVFSFGVDSDERQRYLPTGRLLKWRFPCHDLTSEMSEYQRF